MEKASTEVHQYVYKFLDFSSIVIAIRRLHQW